MSKKQGWMMSDDEVATEVNELEYVARLEELLRDVYSDLLLVEDLGGNKHEVRCGAVSVSGPCNCIGGRIAALKLGVAK